MNLTPEQLSLLILTLTIAACMVVILVGVTFGARAAQRDRERRIAAAREWLASKDVTSQRIS